MQKYEELPKGRINNQYDFRRFGSSTSTTNTLRGLRYLISTRRIRYPEHTTHSDLLFLVSEEPVKGNQSLRMMFMGHQLITSVKSCPYYRN